MTIDDRAVAPAPLGARLGRLLSGRWSRRTSGRATATDGLPELALTPSPQTPLVAVGNAERLPEIERIEMAGSLDAQRCATVFARLQAGASAKLLDLVASQGITAELFTSLAQSWHAPRGRLRRLAIVLAYGNWVALHRVILRRLRVLVDRDIEIGVFYEQQRDSIAGWFAGGPIVHDQLAAVIAWLRDEARPSRTWPMVLDTTAMLVRGFAARDEVPGLLLELAAIARTFGGPLGAAEAAKYSEAALAWIGDTPCRVRCHALRALASARLRTGEVGAGVTLLEAAITTAAVIGDRSEEAGAHAAIGLHILDAGHAARAAARFSSALALVTDDDPQRATLHHYLARALFEQGQHDDAAEHHAVAALSLRWDPEGQLAGEDRALLAQIRARRPRAAVAAGRREPARFPPVGLGTR